MSVSGLRVVVVGGGLSLWKPSGGDAELSGAQRDDVAEVQNDFRHVRVGNESKRGDPR